MPPPGLVVGSGKFEMPWLRMHREYARNLVKTVAEDPPAPGELDPPHPETVSASPASAAVNGIGRASRGQFRGRGPPCRLGSPRLWSGCSALDGMCLAPVCSGWFSVWLYAVLGYAGLTEPVTRL
jgi:hypothetical protein